MHQESSNLEEEQKEIYSINQQKELIIKIQIKKGETKKIKRKFMLEGSVNHVKTLVINEGGNIEVEDEYMASGEGARNNIDLLIIGKSYSSTRIAARLYIDNKSKDSENRLHIDAYKLSPNARIEIRPEVVIKCMNIRSAAHGGKIKYIKGREKMYLESRGLRVEEIKKILISSFLDSLLS